SKEPFSNSPDPEFFYHSREHLDCLQKLELSLLLRRGMNIIIGDVGTGKTTLCRQLIRRFSKREEVDTHLILDPHFVDANEFLITVAKMFTAQTPPKNSNNWQLKEYIKQYLYHSGVDQKRTTILIIDEGQKIPVFCLEILREFLNYETNEYKLLQIVVFAQKEFEKTVQKHPNFADRINLYHYLRPLNFRDTRMMIKFRLVQSRGSGKRLKLFSFVAMATIYRATDGYPRKIINLCHQCILTMIIQNKTSIGYFLVRSCARRVFRNESTHWKKLTAAAAITACVAAILLFLMSSNQLKAYLPWEFKDSYTAVLPEKKKPEIRPMPKPDTAARHAQIPPTEAQKWIPVEITPLPSAETVDETAVVAAKPKQEVTAVDIQFDTAEDTAKTENTYAELLGKVTLRRNETLSRIIQQVYGRYNSRYFKSLILANPFIDDPDRVQVGQTIALPAIPANVKPLALKNWWVQVEQTNSLEEAFNYLRAYPEQAPPVRLIPYWTNQTGTKFALILKRFFSTKTAARSQLDQLPADLSSKGKIISLWNENTVFFADPFLSLKSKKIK
ncbi:MAG: AAA family ATPase, partial [Desulfobacterales bacterium]